MPRKVHAASCMVNSLSTNLTNSYRGLWITDALLAETFHKFCHSPRRYGSNVPGPLEARRRASKRKNTSLAFAGGGGQPNFDPAVILGSKSNEQWWMNVGSNSAPAVDRHGRLEGTHARTSDASQSLASWLFQPSAPSAILSENSCNDRHSRETFNTFQDEAELSKIEHEFSTRIAHTINIAALRKVKYDMKLSFRRYPTLSAIAFRHLAKIHERQSNWSDLSKALHNPTLHPPGSNNHLKFVQHLVSARLSRKAWQTLFPGLLQAVELGLVPMADLQEIVLLLPEIHKTIPMLHANTKFLADWHRIVTAMELSRVIQLDDVDTDFMSTWYEQVNRMERDDSTCQLLWRLRKYSGKSDLDLASSITVERLKCFAEDNANASEKMMDWLASLPTDLRGPVLIQATFKMISATQTDDALAQRSLDKWALTLPQLCSEDMYAFPVTRSAWPENSIDDFGLSPQQQLLTVIWIVTRLWARRPTLVTTFARTELRDEFESTFSKMDGVDRIDHVSRVVWTLDSLPLPNKDELFPFLQHFSRDSLIKMLGNEEYLDPLRACFRLEYAQLRDDAFIHKARYQFPEVLRSLAESINTDLDQFHAMAQILMLKSNENFKIVRRLLIWNMELKFALTQAWPSAIEKRQLQHTEFSLNPAAILHMVEKLIMTFAVTPVISPRSAFRHVYKMYLFLHRNGAPINPVVGRALWHAGVTRYGQVGAPKSQVIWCMSKVREIEGEQTASRLLWSAGFRKTFIQDYVRQLGKNPFLPDVPPALHSGKEPQGTEHQTPSKVVRDTESAPRKIICQQMPYNPVTGKVKLKKVEVELPRRRKPT